MRWGILDTNVYIGHWERGMYEEGLSARPLSSDTPPLFSPSCAGGLGRERLRDSSLPSGWPRKHGNPTAADWWEAGRLIRTIGDKENWEKRKRRDFQNDALIALTARRHGATVVTNNQAEFELLAHELGIRIFVL